MQHIHYSKSNKVILADSLKSSTLNIPANSNTTFVAFLKKGWNGVQKLNFNFTGENATFNFIAFILGTKEQKFAFETVSTHSVPRTNAYYYIRAAMFDKSEIDYKGNLIIKKKAKITDSYLSHHTLMLSRNAKTRTIPCLEIEADDVKAGHAATIGKIDEDLMFYLESRGLNKKTSTDLLIKAFMETDLKKIPDEQIQKNLAEELTLSLPITYV